MKKVMAMIAMLSLSTSAMAGFQGNERTQAGGFSDGNAKMGAVNTVAQAKDAYEDTPVTLTGYITRQVDNDEFYFKDSTGEIKIEVEDYAWNGQNVTPKDKITIKGKIDKNDWGRAEVEVYNIQKQ